MTLVDKVLARYKQATSKMADASYSTMAALAKRWIELNPELKPRILKALAYTGNITKLGPNKYDVESAPEPGSDEPKHYLVTVHGNTTSTCTCPDSRKGNRCKHRLAVALLVTAEKKDSKLAL